MRIGRLCRAVCVGGLGFWLLACKPSVPSGLIQPDELEEILYDYHLAQAMAENGGGDSVNFRRYSYIQAVFDKYGVTEAALRNGFSGSRALARAFQKKYGTLPSDYRREAR